jgi:hypothetical protein
MTSSPWRWWVNRVRPFRGAREESRHARGRWWFRPRLEALEDRTLLSISLTGVPTWTEQGPIQQAPGLVVAPTNAVNSGAMQSIAVNLNNSSQMVAAVANGGLWRTTNADPNNPGAITWTPLSAQLATNSFGKVIYDPGDPTGNTFYAGTGLWTSAFSGGGPAVGVYQTTDAGKSWTLLGTGSGTITGATNVQPGTGTITGATYNSSPIVITSTNHGLQTGDVVSISGVQGNIAANGVFTVTRVDANNFMLNGPTGAYGSATYTGGGTWKANIVITSANHGLQTGDQLLVSGAQGNTAANGLFTVTVEDADHFSLNGSQGSGAYTGGGTWQANIIAGHRVHAMVLTGSTLLVGTVNGNGFDLGPDAGLPSRDYNIAGGSLFRSTDGGATFQPVLGPWIVSNTGLLSGTITGATDPNTGPIEITSTGHGLVTGQTVIVTGVLGNLYANFNYTVTVKDADHFYLNGSSGSGAYTGGGTWQTTAAVPSLLVDPNNAQTVYAGISGHGIYKSTAGGAIGTWTAVNSGLISATDLLGTTDIELSFQNIGGTTTLFAALESDSADGGKGVIYGVFTSTDGGSNWTKLADLPSTFYPGDDALYSFANKIQIVADPINQGVVYVITEGGAGVYRYDPAGKAWVEIDGPGAQGSYPHADSRDLEFLGTTTLLNTNDGGINFVNNPMGNNPTNTNTANNPWESFNGNLATKEMYSVAYDSTNREFFGGTQDNGNPNQDAPGATHWTDLTASDGFEARYSPQTGPIKDASNASPIVIASPSHGLATGDTVVIDGVAGNTAANGVFTITIIDADRFSLDGSHGDGTYASSGTWQLQVGTGTGDVFRYERNQGVLDRLEFNQHGVNVNPTSGTITGATNVQPSTGTVADASNPPSGPIVIKSPNHGLADGDVVTISGVTGNTAANGTFVITVLGPDRFSLNGSQGNGTYGGGGSWQADIVITSPNHGLQTGDGVEIFYVLGNTNANFDNWTITRIDPDHFALDASTGNGNYLGGGYWQRFATITAYGTQSGSTSGPVEITSPGHRLQTGDQIYLSYSFPNTGSGSITGASDTSPIEITAPMHGLQTGDQVLIYQVGGNLAANGLFLITVVDQDHFFLDNSNGNGKYTPGTGTWYHELHSQNYYVTVLDSDHFLLNGTVTSVAQTSTTSYWFPSGQVLFKSGIGQADYSGLNRTDRANFLNSSAFAVAYALNSVDPNRMMFGGTGIYEDFGLSAAAGGHAGDVVMDITSTAPSFLNYVSAIVYGGFYHGAPYEDVAIVGTTDGALFFRDRGQASFVKLSYNVYNPTTGGFSYGFITGIAVDPQDYHRVWVTNGDQVFYTSDMTAANPTFTVIGGGPNDNLGQLTTQIRCITVVDINGVSVPLVGGLGGLYRMLPPPAGVCADDTWTKYGDGLPNVLVYDVHYDRTSDSMYIATLGRGAWSIANASATLAVSGVLTVAASNADMELRADANNPRDILVNDGQTNKTFDPAEFSQVNFQGLAGNEHVFIGSNGSAGPGGSLGFVNFLVNVTGTGPGDRLFLEDVSALADAQVTVTPTTVGAGPGDTLFGDCGSLTYSGLESLTLDLSRAATPGNVVNVQGTAAGTSTTIQGHGGNDLFDVLAALAPGAALNLVGGTGDSTLDGPDRNDTWNLTGTDAGNIVGVVSSFSNVQNLVGGAANDVFQIANGASSTGLIEGGGGTNTLAGPGQNTVWDLIANFVGTLPGVVHAFGNVQNLVGGAGANYFCIAPGVTEHGSIGGGGLNALLVTKDADFVLADNFLSSSDGMALLLTNVRFAALAGGLSGNDFVVMGWTGLAYLYGGGGTNLYQVVFTGAGAGATVITDSGASPNSRLIAYGTPGPDDTVAFTGYLITRGGEQIAYGGLGNVTIVGRGGADTFLYYTDPYHFINASVSGTPWGNNALYVIDTTPGALAVNMPSGPRAGLVEVCYFGGPDHLVTYQGVANVLTYPDAAHSYAQALYRQLVHRPATQAEADRLAAYVAATGDYFGAANYVARLPEAREVLVVGWFKRFLGRPPVNGEEFPFVVALVAGYTEEQVLASLLATDQLPAAPDAVFVAVLFADVMGRPPTPWEASLALYATIPAMGRWGLAYLLLTSAEYRTDVVVNDYPTLLHLSPPAATDPAVLWAVGSGLDLTGLTVLFLARPEFVRAVC